jgi:hypothetical protein
MATVLRYDRRMPLTRTRRRILIATIAVAVVATAWRMLSQPTIDERFIGAWTRTGRRPVVWVFREGGAMEGEWQKYPAQRWSVDNGQLTITPVSTLQNAEAFAGDFMSGRLPCGSTYKIRRVYTNAIELDSNGTKFLLVRRLTSAPEE